MRELGTSVDDGARVEVDGRIVRPSATRSYVVLHKPVGVMTTMRDPEGRRTVADVVRRAGVTARVVPVGRLDYDTSGVLLLTDDGEIALHKVSDLRRALAGVPPVEASERIYAALARTKTNDEFVTAFDLKKV